MAWTTIDNTIRKAGLDGITPLFNSGNVRLLTSADAEIGVPVFGATAFGAATTASPSVATANAMTADTSITANTTIAKVQFRNSGGTVLLAGSVAASGADFNIADPVVPSTATSINFVALTVSLQLA
jgi:hypothetical protein